MKKDVQIMVDVEALSDRPNGCLLSIGACKFTFDDGVYDEFYVNVDPATCKALGFKVKKDTVEWWQKQNPAALAAFKHGRVPVREAFEKLRAWVGYDTNAQWWCHGMNYDFAMLALYAEALDVKEPYKYWNLNDNRTIMNLTKTDLKTDREGTYHNALDDCKWQAKKLIEAIGGNE